MKKKALPFALSLLLFAFLVVGSYGQNRDFKSSSGVRGMSDTELTTTAEFYTSGTTIDIPFDIDYQGDYASEFITDVEISFPNEIDVNENDCSTQIVDSDAPEFYLNKGTFLASKAVYTDSDNTGGVADVDVFDINITIPGTFTEATMTINWTIKGDGFDDLTGSLTLTRQSSVDDPSDVTAETAGISSIDLSWTKNGADDDVIIAYNTENTFGIPSGTYNVGNNIDGGGMVIYNGSGTSKTHSGLTSGDKFYYKVFSVNGEGKAIEYSNGVEVSAMTALNGSMSEGFEDGGAMPNGWTIETGDGDSPWEMKVPGYDGTTYSATVDQTDANPKDAWLFSQPVYLEAGNYIFDFHYKAGNSDDTETLDIKFGTSPNSSMTGTVDSDLEFSNITWQLFHESFNIPSSDVYYIGFHAKSAGNGDKIKIDNIDLGTGTAGVWLGIVDSDWTNPNNWDDLNVPDATTDVSIQDVSGTGDVFPEVANTKTANCNNLTIAPDAVLTVNSGGTLNINGDLNINSDYSGTAFVGSLVDKTNEGVTINGSSSVDLEILGSEVGTNSNWHLISSPVASFNSTTVFNHCYLRTFDESTGAYDNVGADQSLSTDMQGFATMYEYGSGASIFKTLEFTGDLNTGNKSIACTKTEGQSGWNLVGNPYPSAVDWDLVTDDAYPGGLDNTLYVVDGESVKSYKPDGAPVGDASNIIPAMQGFFVKCLTNNTDLTFKNDYRVSNQATFLKSNFDMHNVLAFVAENETGLKDYMNVYFRENASTGFDYDWDITKFFHWSELSPQLYIIQDGAFFTNNAYNNQNKPESVEIGFYSGTDGVYKLGLKGTSEIDDDIALHLYDRKENIHVDLREIDQYEFNYSVNDDPARFKLQLNTAGIEDQDYFLFNVWLNGKQLMVNTGDKKVEQIRLYDLSGKLLKEVANTQNQTVIQLPAAKSVYIIQLVTLEGVYSKKIVY